MNGVSVLTKTYVTLFLLGLALFEFWTAMSVFGRKGPKPNVKTMMRLHRAFGYVFLVGWLWPIFVGFGLLERLSGEATGWQMDARVFYHAFLGVAVLLLLLLKIGFVRIWDVYRPHARLLGITIFLLTALTWIVAGWFWLQMMGGPVVER